MDILVKFIGFAIIAAVIFIAFEIPGTKEQHQTLAIIGCLLSGLSGLIIGFSSFEIFVSNIAFTLPILAIGIICLIVWFKKK